MTDDKIYCCRYVPPDEELIREHARRGAFSVDRISRVTRGISPRTADGEAEPADAREP